VSARETAARLGRLRGLDVLSDARGIFALAAIDHRDSLGVAFAAAGYPTPTPERIAELKTTIARTRAACDRAPDRRRARRSGDRARCARPV